MYLNTVNTVLYCSKETPRGYLSAFSLSGLALNETINFELGGNAQYVVGVETSNMSLNGFFDGAKTL